MIISQAPRKPAEGAPRPPQARTDARANAGAGQPGASGNAPAAMPGGFADAMSQAQGQSTQRPAPASSDTPPADVGSVAQKQAEGVPNAGGGQASPPNATGAARAASTRPTLMTGGNAPAPVSTADASSWPRLRRASNGTSAIDNHPSPGSVTSTDSASRYSTQSTATVASARSADAPASAAKPSASISPPEKSHAVIGSASDPRAELLAATIAGGAAGALQAPNGGVMPGATGDAGRDRPLAAGDVANAHAALDRASSADTGSVTGTLPFAPTTEVGKVPGRNDTDQAGRAAPAGTDSALKAAKPTAAAPATTGALPGAAFDAATGGPEAAHGAVPLATAPGAPSGTAPAGLGTGEARAEVLAAPRDGSTVASWGGFAAAAPPAAGPGDTTGLGAAVAALAPGSPADALAAPGKDSAAVAAATNGIDPAVATALTPGAVTAPANAPAAVAAHVATRVDDPEFGAAVSRHIVSFARTGVESAELSLNPAHLGPVSISIQMSGQQASVTMSAEHEATRTALREALPRLDTLFAQSGLQLGGAHVGDGSERHAGHQDGAGNRAAAPFAPGSILAPAAAAPVAVTVRPGMTRLVDTFA